MFAIARKALTDLATTSLEERMGEVFTRRLREMDGKAKADLAEALKTAPEPALVRSAFDLPAEQRAAIRMRSTRPSPRNPRPVRDRAGSGQRNRTGHEWSESGLEHRGLPRRHWRRAWASFWTSRKTRQRALNPGRKPTSEAKSDAKAEPLPGDPQPEIGSP